MRKWLNYGGCRRGYRIVGLTDDNQVIIDDLKSDYPLWSLDGGPSEFHGLPYLSREERGILRRGLTAAGNDRERPR